jgi:hypothetical protein
MSGKGKGTKAGSFSKLPGETFSKLPPMKKKSPSHEADPAPREKSAEEIQHENHKTLFENILVKINHPANYGFLHRTTEQTWNAKVEALITPEEMPKEQGLSQEERRKKINLTFYEKMNERHGQEKLRAIEEQNYQLLPNTSPGVFSGFAYLFNLSKVIKTSARARLESEDYRRDEEDEFLILSRPDGSLYYAALEDLKKTFPLTQDNADPALITSLKEAFKKNQVAEDVSAAIHEAQSEEEAAQRAKAAYNTLPRQDTVFDLKSIAKKAVKHKKKEEQEEAEKIAAQRKHDEEANLATLEQEFVKAELEKINDCALTEDRKIFASHINRMRIIAGYQSYAWATQRQKAKLDPPAWMTYVNIALIATPAFGIFSILANWIIYLRLAISITTLPMVFMVVHKEVEMLKYQAKHRGASPDPLSNTMKIIDKDSYILTGQMLASTLFSGMVMNREFQSLAGTFTAKIGKSLQKHIHQGPVLGSGIRAFPWPVHLINAMICGAILGTALMLIRAVATVKDEKYTPNYSELLRIGALGFVAGATMYGLNVAIRDKSDFVTKTLSSFLEFDVNFLVGLRLQASTPKNRYNTTADGFEAEEHSAATEKTSLFKSYRTPKNENHGATPSVFKKVSWVQMK